MSDKVNAPTSESPLPSASQPQAQSQNTPKGSPAAQEIAAQQSDNVAHALAGAGGGLLSMALTYPLITLSTRAQVEKKKGNTGTLAAAKKILDREGVNGLYAGMESALFGITVTNFVYYYCRVPAAFWLNDMMTDGDRVRILTGVLSADNQQDSVEHH